MRKACVVVGLVIVMGLGVSGAKGETEVEEVARKMTIISQVSYSEIEKTRKRFRYVLAQFVEICANVPKAVKAADMMLVARKYITNAGLEEPLPALAETLPLDDSGNRSVCVRDSDQMC